MHICTPLLLYCMTQQSSQLPESCTMSGRPLIFASNERVDLVDYVTAVFTTERELPPSGKNTFSHGHGPSQNHSSHGHAGAYKRNDFYRGGPIKEMIFTEEGPGHFIMGSLPPSVYRVLILPCSSTLMNNAIPLQISETCVSELVSRPSDEHIPLRLTCMDFAIKSMLRCSMGDFFSDDNNISALRHAYDIVSTHLHNTNTCAKTFVKFKEKLYNFRIDGLRIVNNLTFYWFTPP